MLVERAVRKIDAKNVHAIVNHSLDGFGLMTGRAKRGDYFGLYHFV